MIAMHVGAGIGGVCAAWDGSGSREGHRENGVTTAGLLCCY